VRHSFAALAFLFACAPATGGTGPEAASARMDQDVAAGRALVAHVVVALVDNEHQGIVPVPAALGDGAAPRSNLYWGALYGVRTHFRGQRSWRALPIEPARDPRVLDRALFQLSVERGGTRAKVFLVAEAWKGERIADAIRHFLELNRGGHVERLSIEGQEFEAGGAAHVVAFIGHNGLMDFAPPELQPAPASSHPRASIVLACFSGDYFTPLLATHSVPLLTTNGLMAPEAYTLDAALRSWFSGASPAQVRAAAAGAYARYQKISERSALRLFRSPTENRRP
jgi:hypothetical protein